MASSYISGLSFADLQRLREAVKRVHLHYSADFCSDLEADRIIEALGPETRERMIAAHVDGTLSGGKP